MKLLATRLALFGLLVMTSVVVARGPGDPYDLTDFGVSTGGGDFTATGLVGGDQSPELSGGDLSLEGGMASSPPPPPTLPCPADTDGSGAVNVTDLLELLSAWGPCPAPCPPDHNEDGAVNVTDLLELLSSWGSCPGA